MSLSDNRGAIAAAALAGLAGAAAGAAVIVSLQSRRQESQESQEVFSRQTSPRASIAEVDITPSADGKLSTAGIQRASVAGVVGRWTKPVVIASAGLEDMAKALRKRLGCEEFSAAEGPTLQVDKFKSEDLNIKVSWQRVVGRKIVFLFDTVDQSKFFEQLSILQALQGFAVPDGEDKTTKWKTYVDGGKYSWGRASQITVVIPWYRPCQMERTSRWHLQDGKWTNSNPEGCWIDLPTAQYMARVLCTPGSVPPLPGPSQALDGMPLHPLWRPPLELLFVELHEEVPISHSVSDLGATIRMERFVPYFLDRFKAKKWYPGNASVYVLFPDSGAYSRYMESVSQRLKLDMDHILYIKKIRVGESVEQEQKLFYECDGQSGVKTSFVSTDHVLIIDDFTNSGSTLFGAVNLAQKMVESQGGLKVTIFVSHLVATYDGKVVAGIQEKLKALGPDCTFVTTNTIPVTTDHFKGNPQTEVMDISDFLADIVR
mmetsp:Transcript_121486/g.220954  ORF Transcript_121486/g.220954 Transcript_121486/m.220954 type:complete len:487 (+) Transcript_121486:54-1514(+)